VILSELFRGDFVIIVIGNVGDPDDEDPHAPPRAVDDAGRNVNERAFCNGFFDSVEDDATLSLEDVIELGGAEMVMKLRPVNIDGVGPGRGREGAIFVTDEPVPPAAGTALARGVPLVTHEDGTGGIGGERIVHGNAVQGSAVPVRMISSGR
jgi:hypothetical protein